MEIFKAYDIRGIYKKDFDEIDVRKIGYSFALFFKEEVVGVGRDTRLHSKEIYENLKLGLGSKKAIVNFGITTLPILTYMSIIKNIPAIMITASHNPPEYNGFKPIHAKGIYFKTEEILKIKEIYNSIKDLPDSENIEEFKQNPFPLYENTLIGKFKQMDLAIGFDPSNGSGFKLKNLLTSVFSRVVSINDFPDGRFPSHLPDPSKPENLKDVGRIVKENNLDFGFSLDCDGDRVGFVDSKGEPIPSEKIIYLFMKYLCKPKDKVVLEVMSSFILDELSEELEIKIIRSRTGRIFLRPLAKKIKARFFAEYSGHYGFKSFYYIDDGVHTALMFAKVIYKNNIDLEEELKEFPEIYKRYFEVETENPKLKMQEIIKKIQKENLEFETIDGANIKLKDGRILIRPSHTEPKLRVLIEAKNKEKLRELEKLARKFL